MGVTAQLSFALKNIGRISVDLGEVPPAVKLGEFFSIWAIFAQYPAKNFDDLGEIRPNR
jgi:hypothetical protein